MALLLTEADVTRLLRMEDVIGAAAALLIERARTAGAGQEIPIGR